MCTQTHTAKPASTPHDIKQWLTVSAAVIPFYPGFLGLEYFHEHRVQLYALHTHPTECGQEEIVQQSGNHRTQDLQTHVSQSINLHEHNTKSMKLHRSITDSLQLVDRYT
jgi:hypothetical protein